MLQIQVHITLPRLGPGHEYGRELLDELAERWLQGDPLPKRVKVTAISWNGGRPVKGAKMENARFRFSQIHQVREFTFVSSVG